MLHQFGYVAATLALLATSASAAPVARAGMSLASRETSLTAAARVIAGDTQCPVSSGDTVNAHVFVAVKVHEVATLKLNSNVLVDSLGNVVDGVLGTAGTILQPVGNLLATKERRGLFGDLTAGLTGSASGSATTNVGGSESQTSPPSSTSASDTTLTAGLSASVELDLLVCLCVDASVNVANIPLTSINAAAVADVEAYARADAAAGTTLNTLGTLLSTTGLVGVDVVLTPVGGTLCGQCSSTQYPICSGGQCGCADCPSGMQYNSHTGSCTLSPSAGSKLRARSLPGYWTPSLIKGKQAKREDIVKRLTAKSAAKTS